MTYTKIAMTDDVTGYIFTEEIRAETADEALEIAKEIYPKCYDFEVVDE